MTRIALGVEYCGAAYHGWQSQIGHASIQENLERALSAVAGEPVAVVAAGRTDTGVHATGQVVHVDVPVDRPSSAWTRGVNSFLPADIAVRWVAQVDASFHARFSAESRRYRYYLLNRPLRSGVLAGRVGWDFHPLDAGGMAEAAGALLGTHDFSSFRAAECQAKSPVRTMTRAEVRRHGDFIVFDFAANAFLHHMVRNLVGALVYVGKGRYPVEWMSALIDRRDRRTAPPTFMAAGLYLVEVTYPAGCQLPTTSTTVFPWEVA